jgi:hypothetical protein
MAAIVLKQANAGIVDRYGVGEPMLDKTIDSVVELWNSLPMQGAQFYRTVTPTGGSYKEAGYDNVLPLPVINSDTDRMPFATPVKGFPKNFTTTEYRLAVQVERRFTEEELHGKARSLVSGLMDSYRRQLEYAFVDPFNNATSTAAAYVGADGVALASASHPYRLRQTGTWSNIETSAALTHTTFSTARTNMRKRKNHFGYETPVAPKRIVVCADKEEAARRILNSEKVSGGSLNDVNVFQGAVDIFVWDYITSTTAWMLWGDIPSDKGGMIYGNEVPGNIAPCRDADTSTDIIWAERIRAIYTVGLMVEPNLQYNAGA